MVEDGRVICFPSRNTRPVVGGIRYARVRSRVDFPVPVGPMTATSSSLYTAKFTFLKMNLDPYANPRSSQANSVWTWSAGGALITAFVVTGRTT